MPRTAPTQEVVPDATPSRFIAMPDKARDALLLCEKISQESTLACLQTLPRFERAVMLANAIQQLRQAVTPLMPFIMPLMGSRLGFRTDRDGSNKEAYPVEVVRDCFIEATLRGLNHVGNEWNIIAGTCYTTLEGYSRLVSELQGLTDLELDPGIPVSRSGGVIVPYQARWRIHGVPQKLSQEFPIRVNQGMGADAILGKARRKVLKAIYERVTGSQHSDAGDVEDELLLQQPTATAGLLSARDSKAGLTPRGILLTQLNTLMRERGLSRQDLEEHCQSIGATPDTLTEPQLGEVLRILRGMPVAGGRPSETIPDEASVTE